MNNTQENPDWAPDDCPDDVVKLIDVDSSLGALGLRGLASSDSNEVRAGFRQLTGLLRANYFRGLRAGIVVGLLAGTVMVGAAALLLH